MAFPALCTIEYQIMPPSPTPISQTLANIPNQAPNRVSHKPPPFASVIRVEVYGSHVLINP
jgi:hypothetical protein